MISLFSDQTIEQRTNTLETRDTRNENNMNNAITLNQKESAVYRKLVESKRGLKVRNLAALLSENSAWDDAPSTQSITAILKSLTSKNCIKGEVGGWDTVKTYTTVRRQTMTIVCTLNDAEVRSIAELFSTFPADAVESLLDDMRRSRGTVLALSLIHI